ncbi:MAG: hypothetical protein KJZ65_07985 [Phycisphaerales bacterium]|nr:hypothetical protein [Phycisphaerales bacterium]
MDEARANAAACCAAASIVFAAAMAGECFLASLVAPIWGWLACIAVAAVVLAAALGYCAAELYNAMEAAHARFRLALLGCGVRVL